MFGGGRGGLFVLGEKGEIDGEGAALAGGAGDDEAALMAFDNFLRDIEAQANTAAGAGLDINFGDAIETLKNVGELFRRNADAVVCDSDDGLAVLLCKRDVDGRVGR